MRKDSGQIVLMLVLITIVGLTIALSLISRTVTDIRISSQIEQSGRAFSAAEAGVENALKGSVVGGVTGNVTFPDAKASYSISEVGGSTTAINFPVTSPNTTQTLWLTNHDPDGTLNETVGNYPPSSYLDICWGIDSNIDPAMIVSLFYKSGTEYKVKRGSYDFKATDRGNGFEVPESVGSYCNSNFRFRKRITPTSTFSLAPTDKLLLLRLRPVYENTIFAVQPEASLPVQNKVIISVGQTDTGVARKIQVTQGNNELPAVFDFALFVEK